MVAKRHICWPDPDATCLEGGCIHCEGYPLRSITQIKAWAQRAGDVSDRCGGKSKPATEALRYWLSRNGM